MGHTAAGQKNHGIRLSWLAPSSNGGSLITGYDIYRSTSSGAETFLVAVGNVINYTDTSARKGTTYYYEVTALNTVGQSAFSNEVSAVAR